jgi:hypothetical protein
MKTIPDAVASNKIAVEHSNAKVARKLNAEIVNLSSWTSFFHDSFLYKNVKLPFYFIQPEWKIIRFFSFIRQTVAFKYLLNIVSTLTTVYSLLVAFNVSNPQTALPLYVLYIIFVIYAIEMLLIWTTRTMTTAFQDKIHFVDVFCNGLLLVMIIKQRYIYNLVILQSFRIFRIYLFMTAFILKKLLKNKFEFEGIIIQSGFSSRYSLLSLFFLTMQGLFIFAIIGLQIWLASTAYCDNSDFPEGASRYDTSNPNFPNGCNGYAIINGKEEAVQWVNAVSRFDNIGTSMQSVLRIFMMNDWREVLHSGLDSVGYNKNPRLNEDPAVFPYFFVVTLFSTFMMTMFIGIVYYHYIITLHIRDKISLVSIRSVMWTEYEV